MLPSLVIPYDGQIVNGRVLDSETFTPLRYVNIRILNQNVRVISLEDGTFQIDLSNVLKAENLWFSMIGYESVSLSLEFPFENPLESILKP